MRLALLACAAACGDNLDGLDRQGGDTTVDDRSELAFTHPVNPYVLRLKSPPPLSLRANAGRAGTVYWFANSAFVGSAAAGKDLVWVPPAAGKYTLSAVDAQGVADTREVSVEFAP